LDALGPPPCPLDAVGTRGCRNERSISAGGEVPDKLNSSQHLSRIEDAFGVERGLDAAHQVELYLALAAREIGKLHLTDTVFGGDGAAELEHDRVHRVGEIVPPFQECRLCHAGWLGDVVVHAAVAE